MDKMLISGGNGFLGSNLAERAIEDRFEVTVEDDFSTSIRANISDEATIIRERVEDISLQNNFEYIFHPAARPSTEDYITNPVEILMSNSVGTMNLLDMARCGKCRFFYASSWEVYGNAEVLPTPETYYGYVSSWGIRSCYDAGKRYSEALTMAYHRKFNIDTRIETLFNVYGLRIRSGRLYGRVIPRFISQALRNENIVVHGNGTQTRYVLYFSDWLEATWKMIKQGDNSREILNIGSPDEILVLSLAEKIIMITKTSLMIIHLLVRADDPLRRSAGITKAKYVLGWKPKVDLNTGLRNTIQWMKGENQ